MNDITLSILISILIIIIIFGIIQSSIIQNFESSPPKWVRSTTSPTGNINTYTREITLPSGEKIVQTQLRTINDNPYTKKLDDLTFIKLLGNISDDLNRIETDNINMLCQEVKRKFDEGNTIYTSSVNQLNTIKSKLTPTEYSSVVKKLNKFIRGYNDLVKKAKAGRCKNINSIKSLKPLRVLKAEESDVYM